MVCYNTLSAVVRYVPGTGRCKTATEITIKLGPLVVAYRTTYGQYSQEEALTDFRRNPRLYKRGDGFEAATSLKLVA